MIDELKQFIDVAEKNRKYPQNTATGFRVALSIFEPELNDQEKGSLQSFKDNMDAIYMNVYRKNQKTLSSNTLQEYRRRVQRLIKDFEQYGNDPNKMASWTPSQRMSKPKKDKTVPSSTAGEDSVLETEKNTGAIGITMNRFELTLRPNIKAILLTPSDLKIEEAKKIKKYIEYLESVAEE